MSCQCLVMQKNLCPSQVYLNHLRTSQSRLTTGLSILKAMSTLQFVSITFLLLWGVTKPPSDISYTNKCWYGQHQVSWRAPTNIFLLLSQRWFYYVDSTASLDMQLHCCSAVHMQMALSRIDQINVWLHGLYWL